MFVDVRFCLFFDMIRKKRRRMRRESGFSDGLGVRGKNIGLRVRWHSSVLLIRDWCREMSHTCRMSYDSQ